MEIETILYNILGACTCPWHETKHVTDNISHGIEPYKIASFMTFFNLIKDFAANFF